MVQGFYSLEEAAKRLDMQPQQLSQMAQRREVRAFADRGTWRFRTQDIEELARQRGMTSDPALQLGDSGLKGAAAPPASKGGEVFPFELDSGEEVDFGTEIFDPGAAPSKSGSSPSGPAGSDSDVRLVPQGPISVKSDSDVKLESSTSGTKPASSKKGPSRAPGADRGSKLVLDEGMIKPQKRSSLHLKDSGKVNLADSGKVGLDSENLSGSSELHLGSAKNLGASESDVRLGSDSGKNLPDSGVRLVDYRPPASGKGSEAEMRTAEIDLDQELRKAEERSKGGRSGPHPPSVPQPFELSEETIDIRPARPPEPKAPARTGPESSSEFELSAEVEEEPTSFLDSQGEIDLELTSESEVKLGGKDVTKAPDSGINLGKPADSGISLAQEDISSAEEINFDLAVDESTATPQPRTGKWGKKEVDSSSEFELTLDEESSSLAPLEEEKTAKGVVKTDFQLPVEDEPDEGVQISDIEEGGETSDFELALDDESLTIEAEGETGSEVVILEEDIADVQAAGKPRTVLGELEGEEVIEDLFAEEGVEVEIAEEEAEEEKVGALALAAAQAEAQPAEWGVVPTLLLLPTVLVMIVVGFLMFEMLRGVMSGGQSTVLGGEMFDLLNSFMK